MLSLSQTAGYAVHAAGCLGSSEGESQLIRTVAQRARIPKPYLAKIINQLSRKGLVATKRGYHGGIYLTRPPEKISILEIVEAVEGRAVIGKCLLGMADCSPQCSCPTKTAWNKMRAQIEKTLRTTTLADVVGCERRGRK